jgi:uroporphyrinogen-III synthase
VTKPLAGLNILVTRPTHQAGELAAAIRAAGGNPVMFPVLEIRDVEDQHPLLDLISRLDQFDLAIFISPNAVNKAMQLIGEKWPLQALPSGLKIATIGEGGVRELRKFGVNEVIAPTERFDSEALLELAELQQLQGKRVVIFRGEGGRELLGNTLVQRGATLEYAVCYRRSKPEVDAGTVAALLQAGARNELHAITVTSSEGLRNLSGMVGEPGQQWLKSTPVFVPHERIAQVGSELGLTRVMVTAIGDEGLLGGLQEYFQKKS